MPILTGLHKNYISELFKEFSNIEEERDHARFRQAVFISITLSLIMWFIKLLEISTNVDLVNWGIYPRSLTGSLGIFTSPFIHADLIHLLSNTFPVLSLTLLLFYFYHKIAWEVFAWIYLITGIWVWAFARDAYHIGASGLVYGLASYLLLSGLLSKNIRLISASLIVLFLHGGIFYGISPFNVEPNVSWESHLMGAISGVLVAVFFFRQYRPRKQQEEELKSEVEAFGKDDKGNFSTTNENPFTFTYHYIDKKDKSK